MPTASDSDSSRLLHGLVVLVTRPSGQAEPLCRQIEQRGGVAERFPVIEIQPLAAAATAGGGPTCLASFDLAIFVSVNAVRYGLAAFRAGGDWPQSLAVAAVGKATAAALAEHGQAVDVLPVERFDSEGLLAAPALRRVRGRRIVIIRGAGGRELLADTLRARGAEVEYLEVYRRALPKVDPDTLLRRWDDGKIDLVCITSGEALDNLMAILGETGRSLLLHTPLVVLSRRIADAASAYGIAQILLATEASDAGLVRAMERWARERA